MAKCRICGNYDDKSFFISLGLTEEALAEKATQNQLNTPTLCQNDNFHPVQQFRK